MVPRSSATTQVLEERKLAFMNKKGHTHWPNEIKGSAMGGFISSLKSNEIKYDWPELTG